MITRKQVRCMCRRICRIRGKPDFTRRAADEIERIMDASRGRAFVLFTSYQQMRQIYELLRRTAGLSGC